VLHEIRDKLRLSERKTHRKTSPINSASKELLHELERERKTNDLRPFWSPQEMSPLQRTMGLWWCSAAFGNQGEHGPRSWPDAHARSVRCGVLEEVNGACQDGISGRSPGGISQWLPNLLPESLLEPSTPPRGTKSRYWLRLWALRVPGRESALQVEPIVGKDGPIARWQRLRRLGHFHRSILRRPRARMRSAVSRFWEDGLRIEKTRTHRSVLKLRKGETLSDGFEQADCARR